MKGNTLSRGLEVTGCGQDWQEFIITGSKSVKPGLMGQEVAQRPIREDQSLEATAPYSALVQAIPFQNSPKILFAL